MPWIRSGDGLHLVGAEHYEPSELRISISQLREARNQPATVCRMLDELLDTGRAPKSLIFRLSKWCDWNDPSERIARSIAEHLFYGIVCPRLLDQQNKPIPDRSTAESVYQTWIDNVVRASEGLETKTVFPDDVSQPEAYTEGVAVQRWVNAYERSDIAREKCIQHYGAICYICGFNFALAYDGIGTGHVHVHHLRPLSTIGHSYEVNPIADLRPVCPNCHLVIHLYKNPLSVEDVQAMVARARELHPGGPFEQASDPPSPR